MYIVLCHNLEIWCMFFSILLIVAFPFPSFLNFWVRLWKVRLSSFLSWQILCWNFECVWHEKCSKSLKLLILILTHKLPLRNHIRRLFFKWRLRKVILVLCLNMSKQSSLVLFVFILKHIYYKIKTSQKFPFLVNEKNGSC